MSHKRSSHIAKHWLCLLSYTNIRNNLSLKNCLLKYIYSVSVLLFEVFFTIFQFHAKRILAEDHSYRRSHQAHSDTFRKSKWQYISEVKYARTGTCTHVCKSDSTVKDHPCQHHCYPCTSACQMPISYILCIFDPLRRYSARCSHTSNFIAYSIICINIHLRYWDLASQV